MENNLLLKGSIDKPAVSFNNSNGEVVGKFIIDNEVLRFEGNADESAKIFVDLVLSKFNKKK
jgi:hypothetical protein